ncbi:MAG TPA: cytochrome c-type biogenesis protein CcmH [Candidatus Binataceae bacterium]|nr:cytochrome c-type biogenesis protein CcmH [Candidatus Binataceae bacterium]
MATKVKSRLARLVIIAVCGVALMFATGVPILIAQTPKVSVDEVAEGLTCECGCGLTIANCNHPNCSFSVPAKDEIEAMINRGLGHDAIIASFRTKYGEKILSAPTTQGFNLLAWVTPFVMLLGGGGLIVLLLGRWRARDTSQPLPSIPTAEPSPAETELRRQLAHDLRDRT